MKFRPTACTLTVLLFALTSVRADESFNKMPPPDWQRIGDRVDLFLPKGLSIDSYPPSVILLKKPTPLPSAGETEWQPEFSRSSHQSRVHLPIPDGTSLYGTGEVTGPLLRNGQTIKLWDTDNFNYLDDNGQRLYQSHPWVLGVRADGTAFGFLADTTWKAELSLKDGIELTSDGPLFPVIIIDRPTPIEVVQALAELTGKIPMPPQWALGYQQCRWSYKSDTIVRGIADGFRSRHIPCDVIWMDIDYMHGFRDFTFDSKRFPSPTGLDDYLHEHGFKSVWMIDPGVKVEKGYSVFDSGTAQDVWVQNRDGSPFHGKVWPGECVFPDFTRPQTRQWWAGLYENFMAHGVDGVWNDMNEPSVFGAPDKTMPEGTPHRGGGDLPPGPHLQYHNIYGMLEVQATRDGILAANPDKRPFVLSRANFLGGQRFGATWTGDNASTPEHMKLSVPMCLNLSLSGQPFCGPDLGGFSGSPTPQLWATWIGAGAFFPFARGHACQDTPQKEPWAFGKETENAARIALDRRYRLLPYLYTLFRQSATDGSPIMRPIFFADPKDLTLRNEQSAFMLGGDLIIIPRWAEHPALPQGIWRSISLVGEDAATDPYQADLKIRGGAIIPLGKVIQNTTEKSLDPLTLLVCLDDSGQADGTLYEDSGNGFEFQKGDYRLTTYHARKAGDKVLVDIVKTEGNRSPDETQTVVQIVTDSGIQSGTLNSTTP